MLLILKDIYSKAVLGTMSHISPQREPSPHEVTLTELMAVLLSQMLFSGCQLDNLVLINKIKEQLMAEKIRPPHPPTASAPSHQPLVAPPGHVDDIQHGMSKAQQMPVLHSPSQPDVALHARSASSSVTGTLTIHLPAQSKFVFIYEFCHL